MWQIIIVHAVSAGFTHRPRIITLVMALVVVLATAASGQPNVIIRDCHTDVGSDPNSACNKYYASPDIWLRDSSDSIPIPQLPHAGQNVYVYVQLTNIGSDTLDSGCVHVYYGAASVSLSDWPKRWHNDPPNGDIIGTGCVYGLAPNATILVEIPWNNVPSNSNGDHFCLLARFISDEDPMTTAEGTEIYDNTMHNNNIGWMNLTPIYAPSMGNPPVSGGTIAVYNSRNVPKTTRLDFDTDQPGDDQPLPDNLRVRVILGTALYGKWVAGGRIGIGLGLIDEAANNAIVIKNMHESIGGMVLEPDEEFAIDVEILYPSEGIGGPGIHNWSISQWEDGRTDPIGGVSYRIHMQREGMGKRVAQPNANLATKLQLSAQPNPGSSAMTLSFTLPADDHVTLAIYDMNGRLVRALLSESSQDAGHHEVVWDGESDAGLPVPSGTYFYTLVTREGVAEQQLKVVR